MPPNRWKLGNLGLARSGSCHFDPPQMPTVKELRTKAKAQKIKKYYAMGKADLMAALGISEEPKATKAKAKKREAIVRELRDDGAYVASPYFNLQQAYQGFAESRGARSGVKSQRSGEAAIMKLIEARSQHLYMRQSLYLAPRPNSSQKA